MNNENKNFFVSDVEAENLTLEEKNNSASKVLYEDTEKRGVNTKHFRLQNGNFMAVMYDRPVHKLDQRTGKYVDIVSEVNETETEYETIMDRFKVRMPKSAGNDKFIIVEKDGREVGWKLIPRSSSRQKKSVAMFARKPKRDSFDVCNRHSVKYEKADTNTDLQYDISDNGVKESIVLAKNPNCNTFTFKLKLKGLVPMLSEDCKTVSFVRDDEDLGSEKPEMKIPPAFMLDANNAYCDQIHYAIRQTETGIFLDLIVETDWLSDLERAYPVVIDPRVVISNDDSHSLKMIGLCENECNAFLSLSNDIKRIGLDYNGNPYRAYVGISLPEIAEGFEITKAGLIVHQKDYWSCGGKKEDFVIASLSHITGKPLSIESFTWNNVVDLSVRETTIEHLEGCTRWDSEEIEIDLTLTARDWYNSDLTTTNERFLVFKKYDETNVRIENGKAYSTFLDLYSLQADEDYIPRFYIEYVSTGTYSDHQKYHTFEVGRAGTGSVNLFTGRMSFAHGDIMAEDVKLPLSISHIYRPEYVNEITETNGRYGNGWKLSVEQTLNTNCVEGIRAIYTDAQGKRHYFSCENQDSIDNSYKDDSGLGLTFKEECSIINGRFVAHVISDEKGNKMHFNSTGKLIQLLDTNDNISSLFYTNGRLTSVKNGKKKTVGDDTQDLYMHSAELCYNSNGKLSKIVDDNDQNRAILYEYNAAGQLKYITYPSAESAYSKEGVLKTEFVYGANSRLEEIIDYTGITYKVSYDNHNRVIKLSYFGNKIIGDNSVDTTDDVFGDSISFDYRAKSTAVIHDRTDVKTVYRFDENGREVSSYQDMTDAKDQSKISESTPTEIVGYGSIISDSGTTVIGKYRSLSVSLNNDPAEEVNLVQNCFFMEKDSSIKPTGWKTFNAMSPYSEFVDSYIPGKKSYRLGGIGSLKHLSQDINLENVELNGNVLVASAWAKPYTDSEIESQHPFSKIKMKLTVTCESEKTYEYYECFDADCDDWQYMAIPFVVNEDDRPINANIKFICHGDEKQCEFTNVRLVATEGIVTTNTYRTDENPVQQIYVFNECREIKMKTEKSDMVLTTTDYMDDRSDIVRSVVTDANGRNYTTDYKYDDKHNLIKTQDYRGLVIEYTYNQYGKELTRKTYHKDSPQEYMFSEYTYQDDHFLKSERDPRYSYNGQDLKTTYEHDTDRNLLLKQTSVNGQEYNYTYDDKTDDLMSLSSTADSKTNENQFFYTRGYLTRVVHNGFNFGFAYDQLGRSKSVTVGAGENTTTLLSMSYAESGVNDIVETTYASGEKNTVITDIFGNPTESKYTDQNNNERTISNATYDALGRVKKLVDNERGVCYNYTYDIKGNVTKIVETDKTTEAVIATNTFVFDSNERLTSRTYGAVGQTYSPVYEKNASGYIYPDNEVLGIKLNGKFTDKVTKDGLRRVSRKTLQVGSNTLFSESYGYLYTPKSGKYIETEIVSSVYSHVYGTSANSSTFNYTYDKAGNLETVSNGTTLIAKYYYDGLNRLKREDNHTAGKTYVWDYDVGGNILFKKEYALCSDINLGTCLDDKTYTYESEGWKDRLHSYGDDICTYDAMGNPLTYRGNTLAWTKVRRLANFGSNTFAYGANGIRYQKNNTVYTLDGNKILRESDGTKTLTYYHGGSGIIGFEYNGTDYYFRKSLQGDVTEIYTAAGFKVASYVYDAWGKVLAVNNYTSDNIGDLNPIRYRSYYYDVETGLYYLNSRYYDPEVGRFINADTTDVLENAKYDINGLNLYAYCDNNPVDSRDDEGDASFWKKLAVAVAAVVVIATVAAVVAAATAATGGAAGAALCAVTSTFVGAAKGAAIGAITGAITGAATGAVQGAVEGYQETGTWEGTLRGMGKGAVKGAVQGAADGLISGMVSGAFAGAMNPSFCFVAGTVVLTTLGKKAIETIQISDSIPCVDHITGETAEKKVISTSVNKVDRLIEIEIGGETLRCTETHPFQVKGRGWVNASDLAPNDVVYTKDWNTAIVQSVSLLELDEPVEVFNFEVEDCHTYFVGEVDILVHNGPCRNPGGRKGGEKHRAKIDEIAEQYRNQGYEVNFETKVDIYDGMKSTRFSDLLVKKGKEELHIQVGQALKTSGFPVARERRAIYDLLSTNVKVLFVPYKYV